jgi:two-component system response regulator (stage 0 sporulation protein F)
MLRAVMFVEKSIISSDIQEESHQFRGLSGDGIVNVLVVDDDEGIRETMRDILREMGVHTTLARDGFEAIEIAKQEPPDLIMMDLRMPGIDGLQTSKKILSFQPGARIILVTAYATEETSAAARHAGLKDILYKPLDLGKLRDILNEKKKN